MTASIAASPVSGSTTVSTSCGLSSVSLVSTLPVVGWFNSVVLISPCAAGAGSTICMVSVDVSVPPLPSSIVYGICTVPVKSGSGVKVTTPVTGSTSSSPAGSPVSGSVMVIGPADGSCPSTSVIVTESPFESVSLANRFAVAGAPAGAITRSSVASGSLLADGSGSGATSIETVASSVAPLGSTIV